MIVNFPTDYRDILARVDNIDPLAYGRTRNFKDGALSYLSPYISRGVISTKFVLDKLVDKGYRPTGKFVQELAWRDYWQQIWKVKVDEINQDLKSRQLDVSHFQMPEAIDLADSGIEVVDEALRGLKANGYMHNHMRMYVAGITCNVAKSHWYVPARWMYYYLLDGDWASNALSWQWVAGSNANKKYIANQDNINKYFYSDQKDTFLDRPYDEIHRMDCPDHLKELTKPDLKTILPPQVNITIDLELPTLIYNYYNMDPLWRAEERANRILLMEPRLFDQYPVSPQCIDFLLSLGKNIPGLQVYVGDFDELINKYSTKKIVYKEHPLNTHYRGVEDARDWMSGVEGYFDSFFKFWKHVKKELK